MTNFEELNSMNSEDKERKIKEELKKLNDGNGYVNLITFLVENKLEKSIDVVNDFYTSTSTDDNGEHKDLISLETNTTAADKICSSIYMLIAISRDYKNYDEKLERLIEKFSELSSDIANLKNGNEVSNSVILTLAFLTLSIFIVNEQKEISLKSQSMGKTS